MTEPIKLLDFYGKDDRDCFFGRDDERIELGRLIESYPAVILTGESGIGKTSLLLAGVIPDITRDIIYHRINPGSRGLLKEKVFPLLNQAPGAAAGEKKLIVLDQFEELLLEREFGGDWFPASLIEPLFSSGSCTLLFSLRSDYLPLFMKWLKSLRAYFRAEQFMYLERLDRRRGADILARIMSYYREAVDYPLINSITGELAKLDAGGGIYPPHVQIVAAHLIKRGLREGDPVDAALVETILSEFFDREIFQGFSEYDQKLIKDLLDMLVGRAGLRRKFTLEELGSRLNETEEKLTSLCTALIDRRVLRRTEEGRIEIIHDFLSRYFFDSLSGNERKKRRYQDMFFSAFLDFSESGILLDEKRARMLLHHLEWIHLRREEKIFFLKSLMSLFAFGDTFYLNLAMTEDILDMVAAEQDSENRHSMLSRSRTLFSTGEAGRLKELYEREDVPRVKGLLLSIVSPLDPGWAAGEIGGRIRDWEILSETMLEEMLQTA
ncbi:MAG: ATP-binding protein, partial [Spirochaetales bacterium]